MHRFTFLQRRLGALSLALAITVAMPWFARAGDGDNYANDLFDGEDFDFMARALVSGSREVVSLLSGVLEFVGEDRIATWSRIVLGAEALLGGDRTGAISEWQRASRIAPDTPWSADADLALGLGNLMIGNNPSAIEAFRRAATNATDERAAYAEVSLGRLLVAEGDPAGAEQSFRRVYDRFPLSMVADDAALGLASSLKEQGRVAEARTVLSESAERYERRGRYMSADRDPTLRWDRVSKLGPERLAAELRARLKAGIEQGNSPIDVALSSIVDRYAGRELKRIRLRLRREGDAATSEIGAHSAVGTGIFMGPPQAAAREPSGSASPATAGRGDKVYPPVPVVIYCGVSAALAALALAAFARRRWS